MTATLEHALPLVTVAIPCFNHQDYVIQTVHSIIAQDYPRIELIIIDDGSCDRSAERIESLVCLCQQHFERFEFRCRENRGVSHTLNEALEWCQGDFFSPIASDDLMLPRKISHQINLMQQLSQDVWGVFGGITVINEQEAFLYDVQLPSRYYDFKDVLLKRAYLPAPTALIRTDALRRIGGYPNDVKLEDLWVWLHLLETGGVLYRDQQLVSAYRHHSRNSSRNPEFMLEGSEQSLKDYCQHPLYAQGIVRHRIAQARHLFNDHPFQACHLILRSLKKSPSVLWDRTFWLLLVRLKILPRVKYRLSQWRLTLKCPRD